MFGLGKQQKDSPEAQATPAPTKEQTAPVTQAGGQRLNLVGRDQFARAVSAAVRHGIETHFRGAPPEHIEAAISTAKSSMVHLLRKDSKAVRGLPKAAFLKEVQESKAKIEAEREAARRELEAMLGQLGSRREEVGQMKANLVEESRISGMEQDYELSQRISALFDASGDSPELAAVREQVTALMMQQMHAEREKVIEAQLSEHRREVTKFERRISKLTSSLELTEEELKKIAAAKGIDAGVASIYRNVQGLSAGDDDYETKKELMSSIFNANLELQKGQGVTT
jgi:hypothetical protein